MKFYLSSYKFGNDTEKLQTLVDKNKKCILIANALDCYTDIERRKNKEIENFDRLKTLGFEPEIVDLRNYFGRSEDLHLKIKEFGLTWILGGNAFVLCAAYKKSGFDKIILEFVNDSSKKDFVYAGFSAAGCVLQKDLHGIEFVDDLNATKDAYGVEATFDGVGVLDFRFVPHFDSDHKESEATNLEIDFYNKNNIEYKTLRDGEVLIIE